jgi:RimJ/RimL family protein N-acetyltransferase
MADGTSVELRPWHDRDLALLETAAADEYVATITRLPVPLDTDAGRAWLASRPETEFAVVVDGDAVGGAGWTPRHVPGIAEAGYWILAERRGAGLATDALRLVVEGAFAAGVERLQAVVEPWNVGSQRVLEKVGFEREGLLRGYARYGEEPRRDVYLYARLA